MGTGSTPFPTLPHHFVPIPILSLLLLSHPIHSYPIPSPSNCAHIPTPSPCKVSQYFPLEFVQSFYPGKVKVNITNVATMNTLKKAYVVCSSLNWTSSKNRCSSQWLQKWKLTCLIHDAQNFLNVTKTQTINGFENTKM